MSIFVRAVKFSCGAVWQRGTASGNVAGGPIGLAFSAPKTLFFCPQDEEEEPPGPLNISEEQRGWAALNCAEMSPLVSKCEFWVRSFIEMKELNFSSGNAVSLSQSFPPPRSSMSAPVCFGSTAHPPSSAWQTECGPVSRWQMAKRSSPTRCRPSRISSAASTRSCAFRRLSAARHRFSSRHLHHY